MGVGPEGMLGPLPPDDGILGPEDDGVPESEDELPPLIPPPEDPPPSEVPPLLWPLLSQK